jgi:hypothetical protein
MIALALLGALLAFGLMLFIFYRYLMKVSSIMMDSKQEDKEIIINTGRVPHDWVKRDVSRAGPLLKRRLKRRCLRRIGGLIGYYLHTTLVSTEAERKFILKALRDVRAAWQEEPLEDILLPRDPFAGPYIG